MTWAPRLKLHLPAALGLSTPRGLNDFPHFLRFAAVIECPIAGKAAIVGSCCHWESESGVGLGGWGLGGSYLKLMESGFAWSFFVLFIQVITRVIP